MEEIERFVEDGLEGGVVIVVGEDMGSDFNILCFEMIEVGLLNNFWVWRSDVVVDMVVVVGDIDVVLSLYVEVEVG